MGIYTEQKINTLTDSFRSLRNRDFVFYRGKSKQNQRKLNAKSKQNQWKVNGFHLRVSYCSGDWQAITLLVLRGRNGEANFHRQLRCAQATARSAISLTWTLPILLVEISRILDNS